VPHIPRVEEGHKRSNGLFEYFTVFCSRDLHCASLNYPIRNTPATNEKKVNPTFNRTGNIQSNYVVGLTTHYRYTYEPAARVCGLR
jgi:hypothetical protein